MGNPLLIKLPRYTSHPASGPVFRYGATNLTVDYDTEQLDGTIAWTRLEFSSVLAVKYVEEGHRGEGDSGEFDHITCWDSSAWLDEIVGNWHENFPGRTMEPNEPPLHYLLYCDHAGCLHVIARTIKIIENPELDALNALPSCR